jgi:hypothetical protein
MLLCAMALFGLVGLLHGDAARSSPLASGLSCSTPRGTRTRRAHKSAWRVVVRRMICRGRRGCQTKRTTGATPRWPGPRWASGRPRSYTPGGYRPGGAISSCRPPRRGAILRLPTAPGRSLGSISETSGRAPERPRDPDPASTVTRFF